MLYFIIVIVSTFGGGFMISLEEAAKDTMLDSKNLTLVVYKQIILSIRAIDWKGLFSYNLRDSFIVEDLKMLDYSGLLIPERGISPDEPLVSFSFLVNGNNFEITECSKLEICKIIENILHDCLGHNPFKPLKEIEIGGRYRHYKGGEYEILNISHHTEQDEELVNYCEVGNSKIWSRPKEMFMDGRFQPIDF